MPTAPHSPADPLGDVPEDRSAHPPRDRPAGGPRREPCRVVVDPEGPLLVEGPVEVVLEDGSTAVSDRFLVAVCVCRRSRSYPWCDTSHRRRVRTHEERHEERHEKQHEQRHAERHQDGPDGGGRSSGTREDGTRGGERREREREQHGKA